MNWNLTLYGYTYTTHAGDPRTWLHAPSGECLGYFNEDTTFVPIITQEESAAMLRECLAKMRATDAKH